MLIIFAAVAIAAWVAVFGCHWLLSHSRIKTTSDLEIVDQTRAHSTSDAGIVPLVARYPDSIVPAVAWVHVKLNDKLWTEALDRAKIVKARFPKEAEAYVVYIKALAGVGSFDEAEKIASEAFNRFPSNPDVLAEYASTAHRRKDWRVSQKRWHALRTHSPDKGIGYVWEARAFLEMGEWVAADKVLIAAVGAVSRHHHEYVIDFASLPHGRSDWTEAARRWSLVRKLVDTRSIGYWRGIEALRKAGELKLAEEVMQNAIILFPKDPDVLREHLAIEAYKTEFVNKSMSVDNNSNGRSHDMPAENKIN